MQKTSTHPTSIKIGPQKFKVTSSEVEHQKFSLENKTGDCLGFMDYRTQRIILDPNQTEGCMKDTVLHEVLHAIWVNSGGTARYKQVLEERIIMMITSGLLQVIQDNPTLLKYLTEK